MTADIRDADHIARCCPRRKIEEDGTPAPGAFILRDKDKDEDCLSVNWLECFGDGNVADNIPHVRAELRKHYETREGFKLAVLNVGVAKRAVKTTREVDISVKKDPRDDHRSHACVGGYITNNNDVATTLSEMVRKNDMYPAV